MRPQFAGGRSIPNAVATTGVNERVTFLRKTYAHLFGAILFFAGVELALFKVPALFNSITLPLTKWTLGGGRYNWLLFLGLFMVVGWVAEKWARSGTSRGKQYLGLGLYALAQAIIFVPLLFMAQYFAEMKLAQTGQEINIIRDAGLLTVGLFGALTATVFITKKDFSFMRGALMIGGFAAMGLIVLSILFGFSLGIVFSIAMVVLAAGYTLYYTSQVLQHYPPTAYVAASLALFSAITLMFWYIIQILMSLQSD